jgi:hypothetical protein
MAELLLSESDTDHRYRLTRTHRGFLVSLMQKSEAGLLIGPSEWLYRTSETAESGLRLVMLMNAWWSAITRGYAAGDLPQRCEAAAATHRELILRMDDEPLVGREVRELRLQAEGADVQRTE